MELLQNIALVVILSTTLINLAWLFCFQFSIINRVIGIVWFAALAVYCIACALESVE